MSANYKQDAEKFYSILEQQMRDHNYTRLGERIDSLLERAKRLKPPLTKEDLESVIDSGYGLNDFEELLDSREHPEDSEDLDSISN